MSTKGGPVFTFSLSGAAARPLSPLVSYATAYPTYYSIVQ